MKNFTFFVVSALLAGTGMLALLSRRRSRPAPEQPPAEEAGYLFAEPPVRTHDEAFLGKMHDLIEEHLSEEEFNVTSLAAMMGLSRSSLFSKVKTLTGRSPQEILSDIRLSRARALLLTHEFNISEVAYKVGFSTLNGLSRAFKNKYGVPPSTL